jgi:hypothetical protein
MSCSPCSSVTAFGHPGKRTVMGAPSAGSQSVVRSSRSEGLEASHARISSGGVSMRAAETCLMHVPKSISAPKISRVSCSVTIASDFRTPPSSSTARSRFAAVSAVGGMVKLLTSSTIQPLRIAPNTKLRLFKSSSVISGGQTSLVPVALPTSRTASQKRKS